MGKSTFKVAILGGGITGLTASYTLAKSGHKVTLFEKAEVLGGLATGFKEPHWQWPLERAYHHLFYSDTNIRRFAKEIGFNDIFFTSPRTDSLYKDNHNNYRIIPVDSPQNFLQFPFLNLFDKIRGSFFLAILKFLPKISLYEKMSAEKFVRKYMGGNMWNIFFKELFRKKFGKYAGKILAAFLWARISKRTKKLGYIKGGFQAFINYLENVNQESGVDVRRGTEVTSLMEKKGKFLINGEEFDYVISTLPSPVLVKAGQKILPENYLERLSRLEYLHALVLIVETDKPILDKTYWLNICTNDIPMMFVGQHTNFVDKKYYGGNHIAYIGYYLERNDPLMKMTKEELLTYLKPYLAKIQTAEYNILNTYSFKGPFAQPLFTKEFLENKPDFITPVKNFYIANLDMTYPYDRGTNYAVKLGKQVAKLVMKRS